MFKIHFRGGGPLSGYLWILKCLTFLGGKKHFFLKSALIDKPEAKSQSKAQSPKKPKKGKRNLATGLVTKISFFSS